MLNAPCLNCPDRKIIDGKTCHCTCEKYLEFKRINDAMREEKNNIVTGNNGQMFIKAVGKHNDELISILGLHSVVIDREQA